VAQDTGIGEEHLSMARSRRSPRTGRVAAVALILLGLCVDAVGVNRSGGAALHGKGLVQGYGLLIGSVYGVLVGALAVGHRKWQRANTTSAPFSKARRLYTATSTVLVVGLVLGPLALILVGHGDRNRYPIHIPPPPPQPTPTETVAGITSTPYHLDLLPYLIALGALLAIVVGVQIWRLLRRSVKVRLSVGPVIGTEPAQPDQEEENAALADAMSAGRRALQGDDARAAIIACYAAMEESLAAVGIARDHADSPAELLDRAMAESVVRGPGPNALARLFREARFSTHPLGAQQLAAARDALEESISQLRNDRTKRANRVVN
jgi:hypothetical protein